MATSSDTNNNNLYLGSSDADFPSASLDLLENYEASSAELAFFVDQTTESIALSLDPARLALQDEKGQIHQSNFDATDATVGSLAGSIPGLSIDPDQAQLPWSAQTLLAGSQGNDDLSLIGNKEPAWIVATQGNDRLVGSSALLNGVDYSKASYQDGPSGLLITNDPHQTTIVENNLSPLIAENFSSDNLLVYKANGKSMDVLADIEIIKASRSDDQLDLNQPLSSSLLIDGGQGFDTFSLRSDSAPLILDLADNLYQAEWLQDGGESEAAPLYLQNFEHIEWHSSAGMSVFDQTVTHAVFENQPFNVGLGEIFPQADEIESLKVKIEGNASAESWLQVYIAQADHQVSDRIVIESNLLVDDQIVGSELHLQVFDPGTEFVVDLLVSDTRLDGEGLLGLEGVLDWNRESSHLLDIELNDALPLFQETSADQWANGNVTLTAASLPQAGAGQALGDQPQERFARLTFELKNPDEFFDFAFNPTLYPAIGNNDVRDDQIVNLGFDRPLITQLKGKTNPSQIGTQPLVIEAQYLDGGVWIQNVALEVLNVNDSPFSVPSSTPIFAEEDSELSYNITSLFDDIDIPYGDQLEYVLVESPDWLKINSETGLLSGNPINDDVGQINIVIQAVDLDGLSAVQEQQLEVLNTNDAPELGVADELPPILARQGDDFNYVLSSDAFSDPDVGDSLTFSFGERTFDWLNIDPSTGELSGTPDQRSPGDYLIDIVATDRSGASVTRTLTLVVDNINDPPTLNDEVVARFQENIGEEWLLREDEVVQFDPFTFGHLFEDPDTSIDDQLSYSIQLKTFIEAEEVTIGSPSWIKVDSQTGSIEANPTNADVGSYRLILTASDQAGLEASVSFSVRVENTNDSPVVVGSVAEALTSLSLEEDQPFLIQLPETLFYDPDPDDQLTLSVTQLDGSPLPFWLHYDPFLNQIIGKNTTPDSEISLLIQASDLAGATATHLLTLDLLRQVDSPKLSSHLPFIQEDSPLRLSDALSIENLDQGSQVLSFAFINDALPDGYSFYHIDDSGVRTSVSPDQFSELSSLEGLFLVDDIGDFSGIVELPVEVISREINGEQVIVETTLAWNVGALADAPVIVTTDWQPSDLNPFDRKPLSFYANAALADTDESELISSYQLVHRSTSASQNIFDLQIVNENGQPMGTRDVVTSSDDADSYTTTYTLTPEEWDKALIRSTQRFVGETIEFDVSAISTEISNQNTARSDEATINVLITPVVDPPDLLIETVPSIVAINDGMPDYSGGKIQVDLSAADLKDHLAIQLKVPPGTAIIPDDPTNDLMSLDQGLLILSAGENGNLDFSVAPPLGYEGPLEIFVSPLATARSSNSQQYLDLTTDLLNNYAALGEEIALSLQVVPIAKNPQILDFSFDDQTGELQVSVQRGLNGKGEANADEEITLFIQGIPDGYRLYAPANLSGTELPAGASDTFGTLVLFNFPSSPESPATNASDPLTLSLFLRSTNKSLGQSSPSVDFADLSIVASSSLKPTQYLPTGSRSSNVHDALSIIDWRGQIPGLRVDPLVIDINDDGLNLIALEDSSVYFDLLNNGSPLRTGWIANPLHASGDDAFLVVDLDNDGIISSTSELISEYFSSTTSKRSFLSGLDALRQFDINFDQVIDQNDPIWSELQLWFDDGDGLTNQSELWSVSTWLESIDLQSVSAYQQEATSLDNAILRQGSVSLDSGLSTSFYDVGFRYDPSAFPPESTLLQLEAFIDGDLLEHGDPVPLHLSVPEFEGMGDAEGSRTLVRLLGLQEGVIPNLGIKDSRGDWVFTWNELRSLQSTGAELSLISTDFQSGPATFELMVSRISTQGILEASALTSVRLDVLPSAQQPSLKTQKVRISEDQTVSITNFIVGGKASLIDIDGSEILSYQISGLQEGIVLTDRGVRLELEQDTETGLYQLKQELSSLDYVHLLPPADFSGNVQFEITALSAERYSSSKNSITRSAYLYVDPVADTPILLVSDNLLEQGLVLQEGQYVPLDGILSELTDPDGSEELLIEISGLPDWASVRHQYDPTWEPQFIRQDVDGSRTIRILSADLSLGLLQISDMLMVEEKSDFVLQVSALAREKLNGFVSRDRDSLNGQTKEISLLYSNNAHTPRLNVSGVLHDVEDSTIPIKLGEVVQIALDDQARREQLLVRLSGLPEQFTLIDEAGLPIAPTSINPLGQDIFELTSIENIFLKISQPNTSGSFDFWIEAIANSMTGGQPSSVVAKNVPIYIDPIADQPVLQAPQELFIDQNSRLSFADVSLESQDLDGSELLGLEITGLPEYSEPLLIKKSELSTFRLFLPDQFEDISVSLRAFSREQASTDRSVAWSEPYELRIVAGAAPLQPNLFVNGSLSGVEDTPLPLLASQGGVISIDEDLPSNQSLSFRISDLPEGASIGSLSDEGWAEYSMSDGVVLLDSLVDTAIRLKPNHYGTERFKLEAIISSKRSGASLKSSAEINLSVSPVNDSPVVDQRADISLIEGEYKELDLNKFFVDPDDDQLRFNLMPWSEDSWISLTSSGTLTLTPDNSSVTLPSHPFVIEFSAVDPYGQAATSLINVSVGNVNQSPIINPNFATSILFDQDDNIDLDLTKLFVDPDQMHGDLLQFEAAGLPEWITFTDDQRLIGLPSNDEVGTYQFSVSANDQQGLGASSIITLRVANTNDSPFVRSIYSNGDVVRTLEDSPFSLNLSDIFVDPDSQHGQSLTYTLRSKGDLPSWLEWNEDTLALSSSLRGPSNDDVGDYQFTLIANDGLLQSSYQFTVVVENTNDAPSLINELQSQISLEDSTYALDLSTIFQDVDLYDALDYQFKIYSPSGDQIHDADWIHLADTLNVTPVIQDTILLKTEIRDEFNQSILTPAELKTLQPGQIVFVDVNVNDLREGTDYTGIIGMNAQLRWSNESVELVDIEEEKLLTRITPNLPFAPRVNASRHRDGVLDVEANSAPSFGFGKEIGVGFSESFISVPFRVVDPSKLIFFESLVNQDEQGVNQIITLDNSLNEKRIQTIRTSNTNSKELLVKPTNDSVGRYLLQLTAIDQSGVSTATTFDLIVENVNDAPRIQNPIPSKVSSRDDFKQELFDLSKVFVDVDVKDSFRYEILRSASSSSAIDLVVNNNNSSPVLMLSTQDLATPVSEKITIRATEIIESDGRDGGVLDQNFYITVYPDSNKIELGQADPGNHFEVEKNTSFNLVESLSLFSTLQQTSEHDETYLYLESIDGLEFDFLGTDDKPVWEVVGLDGPLTRYRIAFSSLPVDPNQIDANILSSIVIKPPSNQGKILSQDQIGLPITLWTESFVKGDINQDGIYGLKYGVQESKKLQLSLFIENSSPLINDLFFRSLSALIPENGEEEVQGTTLFEVDSIFVDPDHNDSLSYNVLIPASLEHLIAYESDTKSVVWLDNLSSETPTGSFVLPIIAYDSHYSLGDKSSYSVASIYFDIKSQDSVRLQQSLDDLAAITQLESVDKTAHLSTIASNLLHPSTDDLSADQHVLKMLMGLPSIKKAVEDSLDVAEISTIVESVADSTISYSKMFGSVVAITKDDTKKVTRFNVAPVESIDQLVSLPDNLVVEGSAPKLTFDVSIDDAELEEPGSLAYAIVNIELDADLSGFNRLIKTRFLDDGSEKGYVFNIVGGDVLTVEYSDIDQLNSFMLYGYAPSLLNENVEIALDTEQHSSIQSSLFNSYFADSDFSLEQIIAQIDGSAYLLDVDGDGSADIVRMLLLDNGFFDLDSRIGTITDPLIPIQVSFLPDESSSDSGQSEFDERTSVSSPMQVVDSSSGFLSINDNNLTVPRNLNSSALNAALYARAPLSSVSFYSSRIPTRVEIAINQFSGVNLYERLYAFENNLASSQSYYRPFPAEVLDVSSTNLKRPQPFGLPLFGESALNTVSAINISSTFQTTESGANSLLSPLINRIRDLGLGELLLASFLVPFVSKSLGKFTHFRSESLKLRKLPTSTTSLGRQLVVSSHTDSLFSVELRDGVIVIDHELLNGFDRDCVSPEQICSGALSELINQTTIPGHALRHCEATLSMLLQPQSVSSTIRDWEQWFSEFVGHHHAHSRQLAKHKKAAILKMRSDIKKLQDSSPMAADLYMCSQILHCYLSLGGEWNN